MSLPLDNNIFKDYPNKVLVETGSYRGDGVQAALQAGFKRVISIDNDPQAIQFCINRFDLILRPDERVEMICSDSGVVLWDIIKDIDMPITFWLDAHWQFIGPEPRGPYLFPLLKELGHIAKHPIKDHTIIIDDWHIFYPDRVGYSKEDIKQMLLAINYEYKFTHVDNPVKDGILVAHL